MRHEIVILSFGKGMYVAQDLTDGTSYKFVRVQNDRSFEVWNHVDNVHLVQDEDTLQGRIHDIADFLMHVEDGTVALGDRPTLQ
jgi:hypothetical protein